MLEQQSLSVMVEPTMISICTRGDVNVEVSISNPDKHIFFKSFTTYHCRTYHCRLEGPIWQ
jgi:hypothetical protein